LNDLLIHIGGVIKINKEKVFLKDIAYEKIKNKILFEKVKHMTENSLVRELNMSRTPIREALFKLQHEGFLEIISNQGIVVNNMSINRLESLIDMRVAIESFSLRQAFIELNESDLLMLDSIIKEQEKASNKNDILTFREKDAEFHHYLLEINDNYYFMKMFSEVYELQFTARKRHTTKQEMEKLISDHQSIVNYLKEEKIELAIETLVKHLNAGKEQYFRRN